MSNAQIASIIDDLVDIIETERGNVSGFMQNPRETPTLASMRHLDVSHMLAADQDDYVFGFNDTTPEIIWPIDVSLGLQNREGTWNFSRCRSIPPREARGRARIVAPKMLKIDLVALHRDSRVIGMTEYLSYINQTWIDATQTSYVRKHDVVGQAPLDHKHTAQKGIAYMAAALRHRYEWSISIGKPGSTSFRFATNASGVSALLKERDKGESGRRSALKSWITDHWRQSSSDPDEEIYVRKHLRGGETFMWRGYACEWRPSQYDLERAEAFKVERQLMGRQAVRPRA